MLLRPGAPASVLCSPAPGAGAAAAADRGSLRHTHAGAGSPRSPRARQHSQEPAVLASSPAASPLRTSCVAAAPSAHVAVAAATQSPLSPHSVAMLLDTFVQPHVARARPCELSPQTSASFSAVAPAAHADDDSDGDYSCSVRNVALRTAAPAWPAVAEGAAPFKRLCVAHLEVPSPKATRLLEPALGAERDPLGARAGCVTAGPGRIQQVCSCWHSIIVCERLSTATKSREVPTRLCNDQAVSPRTCEQHNTFRETMASGMLFANVSYISHTLCNAHCGICLQPGRCSAVLYTHP